MAILNTNGKTAVDGSPKGEAETKPKVRIDDEVGFWLNTTKSGKGVIIVIEDQAFISSMTNIKEFADGGRKGVKFSLLRKQED